MIRSDAERIRLLAVKVQIQTAFLGSYLDLDTRYHVDEREHRIREDKRPSAAHGSGDELLTEKGRISAEQSIGSVRIPQRRCKDAEKQNAEKSADAMHAPHIERVIPTHTILERDGKIADYARRDADDDCGGRGDVARARRNRREARDRAGEQTDELRLASAHPLDEKPRDCRERCGDVGIEECGGRYRIDA